MMKKVVSGIIDLLSKLVGKSSNGNSVGKANHAHYTVNQQLDQYYQIEYHQNHIKPYQTSLSSRDRCFSLLGDRSSLRASDFEPY